MSGSVTEVWPERVRLIEGGVAYFSFSLNGLALVSVVSVKETWPICLLIPEEVWPLDRLFFFIKVLIKVRTVAQ